MKRSGIFITVLLSLFMFQSLWNVAAAFCDHENTQTTSQQSTFSHFGHHVAPACHSAQQSNTVYGDAPDSAHQHDLKMNDFLNQLSDDHSDHLPSFAHFMIADVQQQSAQPNFIAYPESSHMGWNNLYQSPHLFRPDPPPVSSPL